MMKRISGLALGLALAACAAKGDGEERIVQLLENGQFAAAQEEAKKCGAKGDQLVRITAFLYHGAGVADSSLLYLRKASEKTPRDPRIQLRLAEVMVWKKSLAAARDILATVDPKAVARQERPWESLMRMGSVYVVLQEFQKAEAVFVSIARDPATPPTWAVTARLYVAQIAAWRKDFPRCISMTDSILGAEPGHVGASLLKGQVLEWEGKYDTARVVYTLAIQKHPDDWRLRDRLEKLSWVK